MSHRFLHLVLAGASLLTFGCASNVDDSTNADSSDAVTGLTDLAEFEAEFAFIKDVKDEQGNYSRGQDRLASGPCYQSLMAGPGAESYQFRRYRDGAAFFKKLGAGPASGDKRPVLCADIDYQNSDGYYEGTVKASDFEIDAALRYRLGRRGRDDGAAGTLYADYSKGNLRYINQFCENYDALSVNSLGSGCLGGADFPGSMDPSGILMNVVYQYAWKASVQSDAYSFQDDPVGRFVSMEVDGGYDGAHDIPRTFEHVRFEKLDAHVIFAANGVQKVSITPKNSDGSIDGSAIVQCTKTPEIPTYPEGKGSIQCRGL